MLLDDAALENKDQSVDNQRDFDIRWTANSMFSASMDTVRRAYVIVWDPRMLTAVW